MASQEEINAVVALHRRKWSQRRIAQELGMHRSKVRRILARVRIERDGGVSQLPTPPKRRASMLDEFSDFIDELLELYPDITAVRLLEELRARGFEGGYTIVKDELRRRRKKPKKKPVIRFETAPGEQGQQDWSPYTIAFTETGPTQVSCFSLILCFCRRQYIRFTESEDFYAMIRQHKAAFERFGGAPGTILYDGQKVVGWREAGHVVYNPKFLAFATHYGFRPRMLPPRKPEWKGKVERPFQYVEGNCLNAREFRDLAHLNAHSAWWLDNVSDPHLHGTTKEAPIERYARESAHLSPLPTGPYDTAEVGYAVASDEGFVTWQRVRYSIPFAHILELMVVRDTGEEVFIYGPEIELVAVHAKASTHHDVTTPIINPDHHPRRRQRHDIDQLVARLSEFGEVGEVFAAGVLNKQRYRGAQLACVLGLIESYAVDDVVRALTRAVRYKAFDAQVIKRILVRTAKPRDLPSSLDDCAAAKRLADVARHARVEPRPLGDYAAAFGGTSTRSGNDDD